MHDGGPTHFSREMRNQLEVIYPGRWVGRGGPVAWPPHSPDLNPLGFFVQSRIKSVVYEMPEDTPEYLITCIDMTVADINGTPDIFERVRKSFLRCCRLYNEVRGRSP